MKDYKKDIAYINNFMKKRGDGLQIWTGGKQGGIEAFWRLKEILDSKINNNTATRDDYDLRFEYGKVLNDLKGEVYIND